MAGAILTQNTSWANVEKALENLKNAKALDPGIMRGLSEHKLAALIRPSGYYNIKARRLKAFLDFYSEVYGDSPAAMARQDTAVVRAQLLSVKGIGPETADSILLYALNKPVFVIDAYTKRLCVRLRLAGEDAGYDDLQRLFISRLPKDAALFNEFHALIVKTGKDYCLKNKPICDRCPLAL
jgi:endonuclease-3 related protein